MTDSLIGPYEVLGKLGSGGMGEVFLCLDTRLHRQVALKSLTASDVAHGELRERVLLEARAAARLNHPHIASIYDVVEEGDRAFIVMEYVAGESLAAHLRRARFPIDRVVDIGRQLASALSAAHAHGVIHRDLKPANVQITPDGSIKVLDFGVARMMSPTASPTATTVNVPSAGSTALDRAGTPLYMAPEQLIGRQADARADIYSLGVVLFEMATGRRPYLEDDVIDLAVAMAKKRAPAAHEIDAAVPQALSAVIAKALEADPDMRYQSARELEAALVGVSFPPAIWRRAWKPSLAVALVLTLAIAVRYTPLMRVLKPAGATGHAVLAILPVDNPTGDSQAEYLGAGFASVVAENFGSIPGLTALSRAATAPYEKKRNDLAGLARELGATFVLDLAMTSAAPTTQIVARLRRPGVTAPMWEQTISGDSLDIEKALVDGVGRALERAGAWPTGLSAADWKHVRKLPTTSGRALLAYSQARALMDRYDVPPNIDAAIALLNGALANDPQFVLAQAALGDAYWEKYQRDRDPALATRATDAVTQAVRMGPNQGAVHYSLGNMQYLTGRPDEAISSLRRSVALQPDNDEAYHLLGQVLADRGDVDAGLAELREATRIRPRSWRHYNSLGFVLYRAARYREALEPYRRATELQPTAAGPFQMLGTTHYRLGDIDEAIGNYEHAVRLGPNAAAYANLALAYYGRKRYGEALKAYEQSLAVNPKSVGNLRNIGDVYVRLGQTVKAKGAYERAIAAGNELLAVNAQDYRTIALVALCEAKVGQAAAAERHAKEARALAPTDRETLQRTAEVHARLGDTTAALRNLRAAIENGYGRREARENDELASLHGLSQFQQLVADQR